MSRALELLTEACTNLKHTPRKMFGGHGFFAPNGGMFAGIVSDDEVILKLQRGPLRDELIGLGGKPWQYFGKNDKNGVTMAEWIVVPEGFYDDAEALETWAAKAHAAVPAKLKKPVTKKPLPKRLAALKKKQAPKKKKR
ncbi:MAG: TfoX/Sxy family protein [Myxococcaceae bacterium]|nr:TfoX/Sxy family protein [Myxococcaceae bacterium]